MHTASTSSLQYAHEEGMNVIGALPHPAHIRTASVADSADDAAHAAGVFIRFFHDRSLISQDQVLARCVQPRPAVSHVVL